MTDTSLASRTKPPVKTSSRRSDIQGLRAVAVILVVAFHAGLPIPGGYVGVDVFFVISGFVITAMLLREKVSTGRISLTSFYVRRFRRLTPALAVMVAVTVLVSALPIFSLASQAMTSATAIGAVFLFANYAIARSTGGYFDPAAENNPLLHTWSLSVEEQFYLIFPLLIIASLAIGLRLGRPRVAAAVTIGLLGGVSLAVAVANSSGVTIPFVPDGLVGFYGPIGRAWEFAGGAILAIAASRLRIPTAPMGTAIAVVGSILLAYSAFAFSDTTVFPSFATLVPVAGTMFLIYAGLSPLNIVSRVLSTRPMVAIGDLSYSWYLWHWPTIVLAALIFPGNEIALFGAALFSLLPAVASYRYVEQPFRTPRSASRVRFTALVAATIVIPVALAGTLAFVLSNGYWSPEVQRMQATQAKHAGNEAGCMSYVPLTAATQANCEWNASASGPPVYLIGDSIAEHYSEGVIGAGENLGRPVFIATAAGCPAYRIVLRMPLSSTPEDVTEMNGCAGYIDGTLSWLEAQEPGLVIMGASDVSGWSPNDLPDPNAELARDKQQYDAEDFERYNERREVALLAGMTSTMKRLEVAGHEVAIAQAAPSYRFPAPSWLPGDCSVASVIAERCLTSSPIDEMDRLQLASRTAAVKAARASGGVVLDLRDYFCNDEECVTQHGELGLYLDDIHISVPASQDLAPRFSDFIAAQD